MLAADNNTHGMERKLTHYIVKVGQELEKLKDENIFELNLNNNASDREHTVFIIITNLQKKLNAIKNISSDHFDYSSLLNHTRYVLSYLESIRYHRKIIRGESIFNLEDRGLLTDLIEEGEKLLSLILEYVSINQNFKMDDIKGTTLPKQEDKELEKRRFEEQIRYENNSKFKKLLSESAEYAINNFYRTKKVFVSYAWPNSNDTHDEAWTQECVISLVHHLSLAGFQVYLDKNHSEAGFGLARFMQKIQKVDHVLVISSRTRGEKSKYSNSGVTFEDNQIIECLKNHPELKNKRFVIPVLLNNTKYCHDDFSTLAEVSIFSEGYLNAIYSLISRMYGFGKENFKLWWHEQLKKKEIVYFYNLPQYPENFVDDTRISEIEKLFNTEKSKNKTANTSVRVIVCGLPEIGKTTLAIGYCYKAIIKNYDSVFWFDFSTKEQLVITYRNLAILKKITDQIDENVMIEEVKQWFNKQPRYLMVFDNVPNDEIIYHYIPQTGADILITSRNFTWNTNSNRMVLTGFSQLLSKEYLLKVLGHRIFDSAADLEYLLITSDKFPGVLAKIVNYLKTNKISINHFFYLYRGENRQKLASKILMADYCSETDINNFVEFPLYKLIIPIITKNKLAEFYLNIMSYLAGRSINKEFLKEAAQLENGKINSLEHLEAIRILTQSGLIEIDSKNQMLTERKLFQPILWSRLDQNQKYYFLRLIFQLMDNLLRKSRMDSNENSCNTLTSQIMEFFLHAFTQMYSEKNNKFQQEIIFLKKSFEDFEKKYLEINDNKKEQLTALKNKVHLLEENTKEKNVNAQTPAFVDLQFYYVDEFGFPFLVNSKKEKFNNYSNNSEIYGNISDLWHVPLRNPNFTGREELLDALFNLLKPLLLETLNPIVLTACKGFGGVGKSQIIIEYIYRRQKNYKHVFWISADNHDQIKNSYFELARYLKIAPEKASAELIVNIVKTWFVQNPGNLIIYDNAQDYQSLESYLPQTGNYILITSRYTQWSIHSVEVNVFSEEEGLKFLQKILEDSRNNSNNLEAMRKLGKVLGWLPLALAQAAAYIYQNYITVEEYVELYSHRNNQLDLLNNNNLSQNEYSTSVYLTWDISREAIIKKSLLANHLLVACAYFNHRAIPGILLMSFAQQEGMNEKNEICEEALGILDSYSLINIDENNYTINIHELLQTIIKQHHSLSMRYLHQLNSSIRKIISPGELTLNTIFLRRMVCAHIEELINTSDEVLAYLVDPELKAVIEQEVVITQLSLLIDTYEHVWYPHKLKKSAERLKELSLKHHGENHPLTSIASLAITNVSAMLGDLTTYLKDTENYLMLIDQSDATEENLKKIFNNLKLPLLGIANLLAGNFSQGVEQLEQALEERRKSFGDFHVETARIKILLGYFYFMTNKIKEAEIVLEEGLNALLKLSYSQQHPFVALIFSIFSNIHIQNGKYEEAKEIARKALVVLKKNFPGGHPNIAYLYVSLGNIYFVSNDKESSKRMFNKALEAHKKLGMKESYDTAYVLLSIGNVYFKEFNFTECQSYYEKALALFKKFAKDNDFALSVVSMHLGLIYSATGKLKEGKELVEKAYTVFKKLFGENDAYVAMAMINLATICFLEGNKDQAIVNMEAGLEMLKNNKMLGEKDYRLIQAQRNLAVFYHIRAKSNDLIESEKLYLKLIDLKPNNGLYADYALLLIKMNQCEKALTYFRTIIASPFDNSDIFSCKFDHLNPILDLEGIIKLNIKPTTLAYYGTAWYYQFIKNENEFEKATTELNNFIKDYGRWDIYYLLIGTLYLKKSNFMQANQSYYFMSEMADVYKDNSYMTTAIYCSSGISRLAVDLEEETKKEAKQDVIKKSLEEFKRALILEDDKSTLSYDLMSDNLKFVDLIMLCIMERNNVKIIDAKIIAYYGICLCYQLLEDNFTYKSQLDELGKYAENHPSVFIYDFLLYLYSKINDMEKCEYYFNLFNQLKNSGKTEIDLKSEDKNINSSGLKNQYPHHGLLKPPIKSSNQPSSSNNPTSSLNMNNNNF